MFNRIHNVDNTQCHDVHTQNKGFIGQRNESNDPTMAASSSSLPQTLLLFTLVFMCVSPACCIAENCPAGDDCKTAPGNAMERNAIVKHAAGAIPDDVLNGGWTELRRSILQACLLEDNECECVHTRKSMHG